MDEKEILNNHIKAIEKSIDFFSGSKKRYREKWVVKQFLNNLHIEFKDTEIKISPEEPPDIIFRNARFEIKEVLDEDRKRHKEYKEALEKAKNVTKFSDLFENYSPQEVTIQDIAELIEQKLKEYILDSTLYSKIDMLFYVNLLNVHFVKNSAYSFTNKELWQKWRSVSMIENGKINFVFCSSNNAPDFIKSNTGKFITNRSRQSETLRVSSA